MRRAAPVLAAVVAAGAVLLAWPGEDRAPAPAAPAKADPGRAVFAKLGCGSCHTLSAAGARGEIGPDLDQRLRNHSPESLRAVILKPPGGRYSMMPTDFGRRTTDAELDALVTFLLRDAR